MLQRKLHIRLRRSLFGHAWPSIGCMFGAIWHSVLLSAPLCLAVIGSPLDLLGPVDSLGLGFCRVWLDGRISGTFATCKPAKLSGAEARPSRRVTGVRRCQLKLHRSREHSTSLCERRSKESFKTGRLSSLCPCAPRGVSGHHKGHFIRLGSSLLLPYKLGTGE